MGILSYFKDHLVNYISQFKNLVGALQKRTDSEILEEAKKVDKPVNVAPPEADRIRYLEYCIGFLEKSKPRYATLLKLRIRGWSNWQISKYFRTQGGDRSITEQVVELMEKDAIRYAMDAIREKQRTGMPLFGEVDPINRKGLIIPV